MNKKLPRLANPMIRENKTQLAWKKNGQDGEPSLDKDNVWTDHLFLQWQELPLIPQVTHQ